MLKLSIIRAWKDPEYRDSLSEEELVSLPSNPAGMIELSDAELGAAARGSSGQRGNRSRSLLAEWSLKSLIPSCEPQPPPLTTYTGCPR